MAERTTQLFIVYQSTLVGTLLINQDQQYQFQYDDGWLNDAEPFALSCSLPLQQAPFSQRYSYSFFSNLIPEGDLRHKIANVLGISEKNDFAMLDAMGGEVAGAINIVNTLANQPSGSRLNKEKKQGQRHLSESQLAEIILTLDNRPFLVAEEGIRLSLAGAQNKLPIIYDARDEGADENKLFSLPLGSTPSTHILKPEPKRTNVPNLAINETYCMMLADHCGLSVAEVDLIKLSDQDCFITRRFDRRVVPCFDPDLDAQQQPHHYQRLHQEDFCQALGILPSHKYESEGGPSLSDCSKLITQYSSRPAADKKRLLQWTLFNYLIGNADAHGKNISFLYQPHCVLSPFYDLLSTAVYPELNLRMSMRVGGENSPQWTMKRHWQQYCDDVNIPYSMLQREASLMVKKITTQANLLSNEQPFNDYEYFIEKIIDLISIRSQWLTSRIMNE